MVKSAICGNDVVHNIDDDNNVVDVYLMHI